MEYSIHLQMKKLGDWHMSLGLFPMRVSFSPGVMSTQLTWKAVAGCPPSMSSHMQLGYDSRVSDGPLQGKVIECTDKVIGSRDNNVADWCQMSTNLTGRARLQSRRGVRRDAGRCKSLQYHVAIDLSSPTHSEPQSPTQAPWFDMPGQVMVANAIHCASLFAVNNV